jgi:hypothetical protein
MDFSQKKRDLNAEQKKTAALEQHLKEMESALTAGKIPTPPHSDHPALSLTKIVSISVPSTASHATLAQKFDTKLNLPPTHEDTPAKMSSSPMADVGRWNYIYSCVPPIASGYRGSRKNATLEEYVPQTNQLDNRNALCKINSNIGRTTLVANNLKSYFVPIYPNYVSKDPNGSRGQESHGQRRKSAHYRHSHWGSHWADSKVAHRLCAQSAQFDTGTKSFR